MSASDATATWLGKRPGPHVAPLTDEWYTGVTQPRYQGDGSITYVLTPPRGAAAGVWLRLLPWLVLIVSFVAAWRFYGWL